MVKLFPNKIPKYSLRTYPAHNSTNIIPAIRYSITLFATENRVQKSISRSRKKKGAATHSGTFLLPGTFECIPPRKQHAYLETRPRGCWVGRFRAAPRKKGIWVSCWQSGTCPKGESCAKEEEKNRGAVWGGVGRGRGRLKETLCKSETENSEPTWNSNGDKTIAQPVASRHVLLLNPTATLMRYNCHEITWTLPFSHTNVISSLLPDNTFCLRFFFSPSSLDSWEIEL